MKLIRSEYQGFEKEYDAYVWILEGTLGNLQKILGALNWKGIVWEFPHPWGRRTGGQTYILGALYITNESDALWCRLFLEETGKED